MSEEWEPADDRFEDELRQLFGTVRVPPRLVWQEPVARPRRRLRISPGCQRLASAGLAAALVAGGATTAMAIGHRAPGPRAAASPSAQPGATAATPTLGTEPPVLPTAAPPGSPAGTQPRSHPTGHPGAGKTTPPRPTPWPGLGNTGVAAGITLHRSGSVTVGTAGAVLQNLDIAGTVTIDAPHVTIRNCRIAGDGPYAVQIDGGDVTIEDSDLSGGTVAAIQDGPWRAYRLHIHDTPGDGVRLGSGSVLVDSYVHHLQGAGVRMLSGVANVTIRHNRIDVPDGQAALSLTPGTEDGSGPVVVHGNLLGGGSWTLYLADGLGGLFHQRGYQITGNRWLRDARSGPLSLGGPGSALTAWSGNVFDDTGQPVPR